MAFLATSLGCHAHTPSSPASVPSFTRVQVEGGRSDGSWIEAFPYKTRDKTGQNLIACGVGFANTTSKIEMFVNPFNHKEKALDWDRRQLAALEFPASMTYADISGNGFNDVIISDRYGPSMDDVWADGGRVSWLENTGDTKAESWTRRTIGTYPGMHCLKAGHFTRTDRIQICAAPFVVRSSDLASPAPIIVFTAPDDPKNTQDDWPSVIIMKLHLVYDITVIPDPRGGLDRLVFAGRDGVNFVWFEKGLPRDAIPNSPYWGTGSVAVARTHDDYAGYIGSCEGFNGNIIAVYTKPRDALTGLVGIEWTRHILEDFGPLTEKFTGSINEVACADVDGDGIDELLVAMTGSHPHSFDKTGVWCYKPIDLEKSKFSETKLSNNSTSRIAIADLVSNGRLDFSTISYSVLGRFKSPHPSISIYLSTGITAEKLNNEVCFRVPRPATTKFTSELEFLDVAAQRLTLVVLPPNTEFKVPADSAVKVLFGIVSWKDGKTGHDEERVLATKPFSKVGMSVHAERVRSHDEGSVFVLFKKSTTSGQPPYSDMKQVVAHNIIPAPYPDDVRAMIFPWVKVEDTPWANGRFKGVEFYNLVGFHVRFADDSDDIIAHIQLWTAGVGVSAGFHDHVEKSFCEIHACIVNGTGQGGMRWAEVDDVLFDLDKPNLNKTGLVVVPALHEHGPLWRTGLDGFPLLRKNDTVDYPWHAWLAGDKSPTGKQSYDVWVAFEFPPFVTFSGLDSPSLSGRFLIESDHSNPTSVIGLKDNSATDGTSVLALPLSDHQQEWIIAEVTGTNLYQIRHAKTGSLLAARWPPVAGQALMGTHSPANMSLTSSWSINKQSNGKITLRLAATSDLLLAIEKTKGSSTEKIVIKAVSYEAVLPTWRLKPA